MAENEQRHRSQTAVEKQEAPELQSSVRQSVPGVLESHPNQTSIQRMLQHDPDPRKVIALQHTLGNQALLRLIDRQAAPAPVVQKKVTPDNEIQRTTVSFNVNDGPYGWRASFDADLLDLDDVGGVCTIDLKVRLRARPGVTPEQQQQVETAAGDTFRQYFNNQYAVVDTTTMQRYYMVINVTFVTSGQHATVNLHAGTGRDNSSNWYVGSNPTDFAHELGHLLGLKDEYIDTSVPNRRTATSPGVHQDHSIMGQYNLPGGGIDPATQMHQRHADSIATRIGRATGRTFIATTRSAAEGMYGAGYVSHDTAAPATAAPDASGGGTGSGTP